jgi:tetratricopeptide (TPR) repeat protein
MASHSQQLAADARPQAIDAWEAAEVPIDATEITIYMDARTQVQSGIDAGASPADAADRAAEARKDKEAKDKEAKDLYEKASAALEEDGDPAKALALADASLKLRKTARTLLVRARALQRLERIDEALKSLEEAVEVMPRFAPAWEQRGMILWSQRRYDEARPVLQRYLELEPKGRNAEEIRKMLDEPR